MNSNIPPGVNPSDIPGNSPEDAAWEEVLDNFYASLAEKDQAMLDTHQYVWDVISQAIQFGINLGRQEIKPEQAEPLHQMSEDIGYLELQ